MGRLRDPGYLRFRRWVDRDLARQHRPASLYLPLAFMVLMGLAGASLVMWAILLPVAITWYGFLGWRGYRMAKIGRETADRAYDERGKYLLPPEYADTESAAAARRRRRREAYRKN